VNLRSVLLLGGTSEIGLAIAQRLGAPSVVLAGRDRTALSAAAGQFPAGAATLDFDALNTADHDGVIAAAVELVGELGVVIMAFGVLGGQETDAVRVASVNYVGAVSVGLAAARQLRAQGHGTLVVLSSVAGERVRRANFVYGSSKAGLDGFAQGLGDSLHGSGARVLIVRPGFVVGTMTAGMATPPLSTTPSAVADATARALERGREIVWVPGSFRWVMAVGRHLPRAIWRRLPF
jgi:decaprenylphospho-beta-D-erythro-pentofuranosid-2-ulose 2-reductase